MSENLVPRRLAVGASLAVALSSAGALAQTTPPLDKNDYALELYQGPLLAPNRVTGLAGATTAVAEAVEGVYNNAAAPAVREPFSFDWFEWEPSVGIALPGAYGGTDFNNRGERGISRNQRLGRNRTIETTDDFLYLQAGLWAQFGDLGINTTVDQLRYDVSAPQEQTPSLQLALTRIHLVAAWSFLGNQLCIGAGARLVYVNIDEVNDDGGGVIGMLGAAPQAGVVVKPDDVPWRIGATARSAVEAGPTALGGLIQQPTATGTVQRSGSFVLPEKIRQPWEIEAGVAYQLGPRPLNPKWINPRTQEKEAAARIERARAARLSRMKEAIALLPAGTPDERAERVLAIGRMRAEEERQRLAEDAELREQSRLLRAERRARYLNWPRERLLLLASVLLTGPSDNAVALEGFIDRERELVGRTASLAPRFAVESEPVPNLLKFRTGVYLEPSRFVDGTSRQHFTFGTDVKIVPWDVFGLIREQTWRLSAFVDVAARYQNFGIAIGAWH